MSIVSFEKAPVETFYLREGLELREDAGFVYKATNDGHLCCSSKIAGKIGLRKFFANTIHPKVIKTGAFAFEIPRSCDDLSINVVV